ncbi:DEAD/DEAH box helicase [Paenibacillus sp. FSL W8-1187]|uniref:Helicase, SNF2/RAD54 family n=1 Tax=Paenibacillus pasadenensis TaxID=217090 RepID=A0A2N5N0S1_9BACL|nr:DEAD/DEAH box helicase [Paenibacillus pasadenensis]PLT43938.1 Helicase, SNF2/RAD54 family [Paenibacillus pasadenensis]
MGWLSRWNRDKPVEQLKAVHLKHVLTPTAEGLVIHLKQEATGEAVTLPLSLPLAELLKQPELERLELVDALWYDEILEPRAENSYLLPHEALVSAPKEARRILGIPEPVKLSLSLDNDGAVGMPHFKFQPHMDYKSWKNLHRTGKRSGPWLTLPDGQTLLIEPQQTAFLNLIDHPPDAMDAEAIFRYVAEVRREAKRLGIAMSSYIESQDLRIVDRLELEADYDGSRIKLLPMLRGDDETKQELLDKLNDSGKAYASDGHGQKVFVLPGTAANAERIRQLAPIRGADIPRFADNSEAFLPELDQLDLSLFGERVKALGIRVYRAQPYVHAEGQERGWFDFAAGASIFDEAGEALEDMTSQQFSELVEEARESGEEFVDWNGSWVRVPKDAEQFVHAVDQLEQAIQQHPRIDVTKLPYILEIFENISSLEFNKPILDAQAMLADQGALDRTLPPSFQAQLKPFQLDGYIWMKSLYLRNMGGLLADDMGLGKTIQVISMLAYLHEQQMLQPSLIVVPKSLVQNWVGEIERFAPALRYGVLVHNSNDRTKSPDVLRRANIVLVTYNTLTRDQLLLGQVQWQAVVCDEAQAIKNSSTAASKAVKAMPARFRLAMTGTPVENSLMDLWSIMDYVQPGLLGSLHAFKEEFVAKKDATSTHAEAAAEQKLVARLSMVYKRRTKSEELSGQIPSKTIIEERVRLSPEQSDLYRSVLSQVKQKSLPALPAIQQLKAICAHPGLHDPRYEDIGPERLPKLQKTLDLIERIREKGEKVLVFTELQRVQELLRRFIREKHGINPPIINGMTERRQAIVDQFNQSAGFNVMILSPRAAGTGLTITSANHVIHYTRWWNPAVESQATDRVYRIGQTKPVFVYYPIVADEDKTLRSGTVEEIVHALLADKQSLASSVIVSSRNANVDAEVMARAFEA